MKAVPGFDWSILFHDDFYDYYPSIGRAVQNVRLLPVFPVQNRLYFTFPIEESGNLELLDDGLIKNDYCFVAAFGKFSDSLILRCVDFLCAATVIVKNLFCICLRAGESLTIVVLLVPGHSILRIPSIIPIGTSFSTLVLEIVRLFLS